MQEEAVPNLTSLSQHWPYYLFSDFVGLYLDKRDKLFFEAQQDSQITVGALLWGFKTRIFKASTS